MSQAETQIKWKPMRGQMNDQEAQTLGLTPARGTVFAALWFFGRPNIIEQDRRTGGLRSASASAQSRALISCGLQEP